MVRFIWGGSEVERKIAWVSWSQICRPKAEGGLGVKDLECFNIALLGKWRWRMLHEQDQFWCRLLLAKYGNGESPKQSIWWKDLTLSCAGTGVNNWFDNIICKRIGEGDNTLLWEENWHGHGKFKDKFLELFNLSEQKNKNLAEVGRWEEDRWVWTLHWNGRVEGVMAIQLAVMMNILSSISLVRGKKDSWFWTKESDGKYSVRSAYDGIFESNVTTPEKGFYSAPFTAVQVAAAVKTQTRSG